MEAEIDADIRRINELRLVHKARTRIISYNAMSMQQPGRWDDVQKFLGDNDIIGISGTRTKAKPGQSYTVRKLKNHEVIEWGYEKGRPFTNHSCGVAIMLGRKKFPRECWRTIFNPIKSMSGRMGAVRIKTRDADICLIVFYAPIEPENDNERKTSRKC